MPADVDGSRPDEQQVGPRRIANGADSIVLERWDGPFDDADPDANFKADVALYSKLDPLATLRGLGANVGIPVGALARYVLARYATGGSGGLLEIGPSMVHRLWEPIGLAEEQGDDAARLDAYHQVRQMLSWLRAPLVENVGYGSSPDTGLDGQADP